LTFLKICKKYLSKIKNINQLLAEFEQKNIKSIIENKNKIYKEISKIINDFDSAVNNPGIINDMPNFQLEQKLLEKLEENNAVEINKIFNFIDHIGNLEINTKILSEQNELLNKKLKNEVFYGFFAKFLSF
jgi:hypothetical protein